MAVFYDLLILLFENLSSFAQVILLAGSNLVETVTCCFFKLVFFLRLIKLAEMVLVDLDVMVCFVLLVIAYLLVALRHP